MPTLQRGRGHQGRPSATAAPSEIELDPQYLDTPMNPEILGKKLGTLLSEWEVHRQEMTSALDAYRRAACELEESLLEDEEDDEGVAKGIEDIDASVRECLDQLAHIEIRQLQLKTLRARYTQQEVVLQPLQTYEESVQQAFETYSQQTQRQKYGQRAEYEDFRQTLWSIRHDANEAQPGMNTFLEREPGDAEASDEDVEVTASKQTYIDPVTMAPLSDPVKHDACKHRMNESTAREMLRQHRGRFVCPQTGCSAVWQAYELDTALKQRIEQTAARKERTQRAAPQQRR